MADSGSTFPTAVAAAAAAGVSALAVFLLRGRAAAQLTEAEALTKAIAHRAVPKTRKGAFRVVTYNILAQGPRYCLNPNSAYTVHKWRLTAARRFPVAVRELLAYKPDVLALQEVQDPNMEQHFVPGLSGILGDHHINHRLYRDERIKGYSRIHPLKKCKDASFYSTDTWEVLAKDVVPFDGMLDAWLASARVYTADKRLLGEESPEYSDPARDVTGLYKAVVKRYDGVLLALLRHRATGRVLVVGQSHLYWHPGHPQVKAMQGLLMATATRDFLVQHGFAPPLGAPGAEDAEWAGKPRAEVILAGDLNSLPHRPTVDARWDLPQTQEEWEAEGAAHPMGNTSGVVALWSTGALPASHQEHPARRGFAGVSDFTSPLGPLTSAAVAATGAEFPITTRTLGFQGTLDYIFVSSGLEVAQVLPMPYDSVPGAAGAAGADPAWEAIPNKVWPSDHLAVGADIAFKAQ